MMENAKADNMDKYRSYIQRRRVAPKQPETNLPVEVDNISSGKSPFDVNFASYGKSAAEGSETSSSTSYESSFRIFTGLNQQDEIPYKEHYSESPIKDFINSSRQGRTSNSGYGSGSRHSSGTTALKRTDPGIYRRLYGSNRKNSPYTPAAYQSSYHSYGSHQTEIEDNRATVLAVKIIKQAIACFAILGIIVLMQQRSDLSGALAFVKKQVVEINYDPQGILSGLENVVKECTRFLGGSP